MRIVQLGKYFPPEYFGGIEVMTEVSAKALSEHHDVTVICHSVSTRRVETLHDSYRVIRCGTQLKLLSQPISLSMGAELRRSKPDLIHFHAPNFWGALMIALFCPNTSVIITHHADVEGRSKVKSLVLPLYRHLARRAKAVIVNSLKNIRFSNDLPPVLRRVVAIPYGVDEDQYRLSREGLSEAKRLKREKFGDSIVVGFIGRLVWYKGLPVLFKAISSLPNVSLIVVGDGPIKLELQSLARTLGVDGRIHFTASVTHKAKVTYLHMMDIFVFASTHITEAFGISQIEAQLCGLPIISTDLPTGVSDININGKTGLVVPPSNAEALAEAIDTLARAAQMRTAFGTNGRERALALFSRTAYTAKLQNEADIAMQTP